MREKPQNISLNHPVTHFLATWKSLPENTANSGSRARRWKTELSNNIADALDPPLEFSYIRPSAVCPRGDITSSLKFAHCKHNLNNGPAKELSGPCMLCPTKIYGDAQGL